ncbi:MAG: hypothetical protein LBI39_00775 [Puniceicoccales bacterium]|nr:hypothetical protein [Puniceicoccales bacterium]
MAPQRRAFEKFLSAHHFPAPLPPLDLCVGRSGVLAPWRICRPVSLGGTTMRSATLHNGDDIARKDLRIGDSVIVERAGEVIPAIVAAVPAKRPPWATPFVFPDKCPTCSGSLVRIGGEVACRCLNCDCPHKISAASNILPRRTPWTLNLLGPRGFHSSWMPVCCSISLIFSALTGRRWRPSGAWGMDLPTQWVRPRCGVHLKNFYPPTTSLRCCRRWVRAMSPRQWAEEPPSQSVDGV